MQLIPKAKPVRIRITSGGVEHSSVDTLRMNFNVNDLIPLVKDQRLGRWLSQNGEKELADRVNKLTINGSADGGFSLYCVFFKENTSGTFSLNNLFQLWWDKPEYETNRENIKKWIQALSISEIEKLYASFNNPILKDFVLEEYQSVVKNKNAEANLSFLFLWAYKKLQQDTKNTEALETMVRLSNANYTDAVKFVSNNSSLFCAFTDVSLGKLRNDVIKILENGIKWYIKEM